MYDEQPVDAFLDDGSNFFDDEEVKRETLGGSMYDGEYEYGDNDYGYEAEGLGIDGYTEAEYDAINGAGAYEAVYAAYDNEGYNVDESEMYGDIAASYENEYAGYEPPIGEEEILLGSAAAAAGGAGYLDSVVGSGEKTVEETIAGYDASLGENAGVVDAAEPTSDIFGEGSTDLVPILEGSLEGFEHDPEHCAEC